MNDKGTVNEIALDETSSLSPAIQIRIFSVIAIGICLVFLCFVALRHAFPHPSAWPQGWFNSFDAGIVRYVNRFANRWFWLCPALLIMDKHNILKGGPIILLFWVAFFQRTGSAQGTLERRRKIAATVPLAIFGVFLARTLALCLPFRERPLRTTALHFQLPHTLKPSILYGWSSFPSDHAVLFVTLAVGLLMASRLLGSIALFYSVVAILFPRIYLGLHWPTDLLAGAVIGTGLASIVTVAAYRNFVWRLVMKCWQLSPGIFAAFAFLLSYEIVDMFGTPIDIAKTLLKHRLQ